MKFAEDRLQTLIKSDAELHEYSGLSQVRLFGRFPNDMKIEKSATAKDTYLVRMPFWCEGIDQSGQIVRKRCDLSLTVKVASDGKASTEGHATWNDQGTLTFTRQFWAWIAGMLVAMAPALWLEIMVALLVRGRFQNLLVGIIAIIVWVLLLPLAGCAAMFCFGSWSAVTVCLVTLAPPYVWATARMSGAAWAGKAGGVIAMVIVWAVFLTGGGWLLWKVVPYVARGTTGWFQWLFGHF